MSKLRGVSNRNRQETRSFRENNVGECTVNARNEELPLRNIENKPHTSTRLGLEHIANAD
ncbi:hypothetical protein ABEB36_005646 [Hypothenemus hampei]|uniref:Uncharacterized protein n=1 Tax=Hypothenemus hampei TaxID=57062 RepID=A0ABD1EYY8_HYPHA